MKKLLSLTALLMFTLVLSLAMAGVTAGRWKTSNTHEHMHPPVPISHGGAASDSSAEPVPRTARDRCDRGDWRACLQLADLDPSDRGVLLQRADWLLDQSCRGGPVPPSVDPTPRLWACGELANLRMDRSPRLAASSRESVAHAVEDCEDRPPECDLSESLPPELLRRAEWTTWCEKGDTLACRIEEAGSWVGPS